MKITILCSGSRGDVQPYVALGLGLKNAGFSVTISTQEEYKEFINSYGLEFARMEGNPQEIMESEAGLALLETGNNMLKSLMGLADLMKPLVESSFRDCWETCKNSDAIICSTLSFNGLHISEKLKVPCFYAPLQPVMRTREYPFFAAQKLIDSPEITGFYNRLTYKIAEQVLWQPVRKLVNELRSEILDLPPAPFFGPYQNIYSGKSNITNILGFSEYIVKKPADWPDFFQFTGYWFLDSTEGWEPPASLTEFLEAGEKPVYVGFGSMKIRKPHETAGIVINALKKAKKRGIILKGWGGLDNKNAGDDIFLIDSIPHSWLFPRMAAVVHHGGAGTTSAGFRSGVPSLLIPFFGDQIFWGDRVFELGIGDRPIPRKELSTDLLAEGITKITSDQEIIKAAAGLGEKIRSEKGVEKAVNIIKEKLKK
jgi:sterol 3beta-glucosyltransferase